MNPETLTQVEQRAERLARDESGAVMVLGIFMCATLVGALWYIAGIGDAIVYRERLQEAADAGAMSVAALNARGMNLIVFINLIMACVLAIRVALKTLQVALIIAETVFVVCAAIPIFLGNALEPVCSGLIGPTAQGIKLVQDLIEDTRDPINNTLKGLHNVQKGIARVVPGGSIAGSLLVLKKYQPFIIESPTPSIATPSPSRLLPGLPVQDGSLDVLCGKAAEAMVSLIFSIIPIDLGPAESLFSGVLKDVAEAGSAYFCELGSGSGSPPDFSKLTEKTAGDNCKQKLQNLTDQFNKDNSDWHKACDAAGVTCMDAVPINPADPFSDTKSEMSGPAYDALVKSTKAADKTTLANLKTREQTRDKSDAAVKSFDNDQCVKNEKKALDQKLKQVPASQAGSGNGMEPMKVLDGWQNGSKDGQALSLVNGDDSLLKRAPKGVRVGAQKDKRAPAQSKFDVSIDAKWAYAQAEYFYDCSGAWSSCNKDEDAMWHLKWRARLRRFNNPFGNTVPLEVPLDIALVARATELGISVSQHSKPVLQVLALKKLASALAPPTQLKLH